MMLSLAQVVNDFAEALAAVDATRPQGASKTRIYRPGIGPLTEADAVGRALRHLQGELQRSDYRDASPKQYPNSRQQCDLVAPGEWAIELKPLRPFGDNGKEAEHWSENKMLRLP
jgi:hypothetical protein